MLNNKFKHMIQLSPPQPANNNFQYNNKEENW